jgi:hypothetical protein
MASQNATKMRFCEFTICRNVRKTKTQAGLLPWSRVRDLI